MAMRGWRRIGIILSVAAFFPLGLFIWRQPISQSERSYRERTEVCLHSLRRSEEVTPRQRATDPIENPDFRKYTHCFMEAWEDYRRSDRPDDATRLLIVVAIDLVLIGFGWLIAWGCIALGRWVHRGFAAE
jgi:hypothetical protein